MFAGGPAKISTGNHFKKIIADRPAKVKTGARIKDLVAGNILAPDEPWIRGYLGLPAANNGAIG
ncbi:MAG: hypothetical protein M3Y13_09600 [Armatimonadota bacterium]|nr:hypothetical protein [Armatimonadota bacterium]